MLDTVKELSSRENSSMLLENKIKKNLNLNNDHSTGTGTVIGSDYLKQNPNNYNFSIKNDNQITNLNNNNINSNINKNNIDKIVEELEYYKIMNKELENKIDSLVSTVNPKQSIENFNRKLREEDIERNITNKNTNNNNFNSVKYEIRDRPIYNFDYSQFTKQEYNSNSGGLQDSQLNMESFKRNKDFSLKNSFNNSENNSKVMTNRHNNLNTSQLTNTNNNNNNNLSLNVNNLTDQNNFSSKNFCNKNKAFEDTQRILGLDDSQVKSNPYLTNYSNTPITNNNPINYNNNNNYMNNNTNNNNSMNIKETYYFNKNN